LCLKIDVMVAELARLSGWMVFMLGRGKSGPCIPSPPVPFCFRSTISSSFYPFSHCNIGAAKGLDSPRPGNASQFVLDIRHIQCENDRYNDVRTSGGGGEK